ncbi:NUDIX hydrolase [Patescibacteria group bacterium]|nr:NUDIX hydrolase [Patescibacteria group bacterium]
MENKTKLVVLGLIKNNENKYLLSQRYDLDVPEAHLKWDLIGGTNEFGESLEETLYREVLEESGLKVEILNLLPKSTSRHWQHSQYNIHAIVVCYHCKVVGVELFHLNDPKINDLKWVDKESLKDYDFLPTTEPFIDLI